MYRPFHGPRAPSDFVRPVRILFGFGLMTVSRRHSGRAAPMDRPRVEGLRFVGVGTPLDTQHSACELRCRGGSGEACDTIGVAASFEPWLSASLTVRQRPRCRRHWAGHRRKEAMRKNASKMRSNAPSRNERGERRSRTQGAVTRTESEWENTGAFTGIGRPKVVGVSEQVALSTRRMASAARRAERQWLKSLPKGTKI